MRQFDSLASSILLLGFAAIVGCDQSAPAANDQTGENDASNPQCVVILTPPAASGAADVVPAERPPSNIGIGANDVDAAMSKSPVAIPGSASSPAEAIKADSPAGEQKPPAESPTRLPDPPVPDGKLHKISFDDVKLGLKKDEVYDSSMLTEAVKKLNGQKISVRGWVHPSAVQKKNQRFVFVRDNQECCFGPGAAIYDCMLVDMNDDVAGPAYSNRPITVEGVFTIDEVPGGPNGNPIVIYHVQADRAGG